jgi:hypothetical protein
MATEGYETLTLIWDGCSIEVAYQENWLNTGQWHLELRCTDLIPVTQTGYRSAFVSRDAIAEKEDVGAYVLAWLDHAARDPAWKKQLADSRQLKLF